MRSRATRTLRQAGLSSHCTGRTVQRLDVDHDELLLNLRRYIGLEQAQTSIARGLRARLAARRLVSGAVAKLIPREAEDDLPVLVGEATAA